MTSMDYMAQALSLAKLAVGQVSPNPAVGALLVKDDVIIGQGYTQPPGSCHAEIQALNDAGENARNSSMYVTLEPCCHYGRTPPCTKAITAAGVSEVHIAMLDPNPLVSGKGKAELEENNIKIYVGENEAEAKQINEAYIKYITTGLPFIIAKYAMSLDGKIATRTGDSKWISGEESRKHAHNLRYTADAIMVGIDTVLVDDPQLTCRCCGGKGGIAKKQPLRIIVDSKGRTPLTARVLGEQGRTIIALGKSATSEELLALVNAGAELLESPSPDGSVDLTNLMKMLGEREITNILVEGGSTLLGSMFDLGLVDKVVVFVAPIIIGGNEAKTAVAGEGIDRVADSFKLKNTVVERLGEDIVISGYIKE